MAISWATFQTTDFYHWFHLAEVGRAPGEGGTVAIHLKPGAFQEWIDLRFTIDGQQMLQGATLRLERAWMEQAGVAAASAIDLSASFLATLAPDFAAARDLADHLRQRLRRNPGTIIGPDALGDSAPLPRTSQQPSMSSPGCGMRRNCACPPSRCICRMPQPPRQHSRFCSLWSTQQRAHSRQEDQRWQA